MTESQRIVREAPSMVELRRIDREVEERFQRYLESDLVEITIKLPRPIIKTVTEDAGYSNSTPAQIIARMLSKEIGRRW